VRWRTPIDGLAGRTWGAKRPRWLALRIGGLAKGIGRLMMVPDRLAMVIAGLTLVPDRLAMVIAGLALVPGRLAMVMH
jgi:hypothetical protein